MFEALMQIWQFLCELKSIFITIYFAIHGLLRFIVRMPIACYLFISALPEWVAPVAFICLLVGFACLVLGRQ